MVAFSMGLATQRTRDIVLVLKSLIFGGGVLRIEGVEQNCGRVEERELRLLCACVLGGFCNGVDCNWRRITHR